MSNSVLKINHSYFDNIYDNKVKPALVSWEELSSLLVSGHPVVVGDKRTMPSFSAWRYKSIDDPTVDHGERNGRPLRCFNETHVRRLKSNLVEMSMLIIDFDGGLAIDDVQNRFGEYEYACSTSLRHRFEDKDRFRVVLPFADPMPKADFQRLHPAIEKWINGEGCNVADDATYSAGQVFLLPAVYEGDAVNARAWRNEGALLDWRRFESILTSPVREGVAHTAKPREWKSNYRLLPDDVLYTASGMVLVKEIDQKISKVLCPFHGDIKPSEFAAVSNGTPYLVCRKCGTIYMERSGNDDGIVSGLKRIAERKRAREVKEVKQ